MCKPCFGLRPGSYAICMKTIRELGNLFILPLHIEKDTQLTNCFSNNWNPFCEKKIRSTRKCYITNLYTVQYLMSYHLWDFKLLDVVTGYSGISERSVTEMYVLRLVWPFFVRVVKHERKVEIINFEHSLNPDHKLSVVFKISQFRWLTD